MSNPNETDPFNPSSWPKTNPGQNPNPNEPQPINYNQQQVPPNYNQQTPPNYNQQVPPGGYQQNYPPPGGYNPYMNYPGGPQVNVPGSSTAQVCGIIGLILFFNLIGLILNIVAITNGSKAMREFTAYPGRYTQTSFNKAKSGKTCGIIGLSLFGFGILIVIGIVAANS
jgi:hypothetical protein